MTNKTFYLAVDNKSGANIPWKYFRFMRRDAENPSKNRLFVNPDNSNLLFKEFGIIAEYEKFDFRTIRNACIMYMRRHDESVCINILKRTKRDTYELIERIYPDGISVIDENTKGWGWITDYNWNEENTFEI